MKPEPTELDETLFRQILTRLTQSRGDNPDWPLALLSLFEAEFVRDKQVWYSGQSLFMDRDDFDHSKAVSPEKSKTRILYNLCREQSRNKLAIGDETFWLVSWEVPCFGNRSHQCGDLLGVNRQGGLVVFECKLENKYAPITSVVEGLDYLTCLTAEPNFTRLNEEFQSWRSKEGAVQPIEFQNVRLNFDGPHEVVVLATPQYFEMYRLDPTKKKNSRRGIGWEEFAGVSDQGSPRLKIRFAETDFASPTATWVTE